MRELAIANAGLAHHDPDLDEASTPRTQGWRPLFGQAESASQHLSNQGVGPGDVFLFFGRFRGTRRTANGLEFFGAAIHAIWGFLEVDEVRYPARDPDPPVWAADHPHYACRDERWFDRNNRVYVGRPESRFQPGKDGAGLFRTYHDLLRLTAPPPNVVMSRWRLPIDFYPTAGARLTNTSPSEWTTDGNYAYLQAIGQRQEFVMDLGGAIEDWVRQIIRRGGS
jgi:hypothetical protein